MAPDRELFKDFDEVFEQENEERQPISFKYHGETFEVVPQLDMSVVMNVGALQGGNLDADAINRLEKIFVGILGKENYDRLLEVGLQIPHALKILGWVMDNSLRAAEVGELDEAADPEDEMGKANGSASGLTNSSGTGDNSRETSGGFTMSVAESS